MGTIEPRYETTSGDVVARFFDGGKVTLSEKNGYGLQYFDIPHILKALKKFRVLDLSKENELKHKKDWEEGITGIIEERGLCYEENQKEKKTAQKASGQKGQGEERQASEGA